MHISDLEAYGRHRGMRVAALLLTLCCAWRPALAQRASALAPMTGRQLFVAGCANCHASDGRGTTRSQVGFADAIPDFTDCAATSREAASPVVMTMIVSSPAMVPTMPGTEP